MSSQLGTFVTSSLPLAAYLVASGNLPLREIALIDSKRAAFMFEDQLDRGPELQRQFEDGSATVSALKFHLQLRILRRNIDDKIFANSGVTEQNRKQRTQGYAQHRTSY